METIVEIKGVMSYVYNLYKFTQQKIIDYCWGFGLWDEYLNSAGFEISIIYVYITKIHLGSKLGSQIWDEIRDHVRKIFSLGIPRVLGQVGFQPLRPQMDRGQRRCQLQGFTIQGPPKVCHSVSSIQGSFSSTPVIGQCVLSLLLSQSIHQAKDSILAQSDSEIQVTSGNWNASCMAII